MPFRTTVRELFDSLASTRVVRGELAAVEAVMGGQSYRFERPIAFEIILTNAGAGIVAEGRATALAVTACSRCLCDAHVEVDAEVDGFYAFEGHSADIPEEQEVEFIADDMTIDLEPAITAAVLVELPFAPLHDVECLGICPVCGADRNTEPCGCVPAASEGPFSALSDLQLPGDAD